jgi:hypothetical protein
MPGIAVDATGAVHIEDDAAQDLRFVTNASGDWFTTRSMKGRAVARGFTRQSSGSPTGR